MTSTVGLVGLLCAAAVVLAACDGGSSPVESAARSELGDASEEPGSGSPRTPPSPSATGADETLVGRAAGLGAVFADLPDEYLYLPMEDEVLRGQAFGGEEQVRDQFAAVDGRLVVLPGREQPPSTVAVVFAVRLRDTLPPQDAVRLLIGDVPGEPQEVEVGGAPAFSVQLPQDLVTYLGAEGDLVVSVGGVDSAELRAVAEAIIPRL